MRRDPRAKLALALGFGLLVMVTRETAGLLGAWVVLGGLVVALGCGREYLRWLAVLLPMAVFFGGLTAFSLGLRDGLSAGLGLVVLTSVFYAFFAVTDPEDLANALVRMGAPFAAAFVLSAALQFVPIIRRKARNVIDAQRSRGIPLEPGWRALRRYPAFLVPLLLQAFQLAEELAEAMETRGFGRPGRTFLHDYRLKPADWAMTGLGLLLAAAALWRAWP
jgi:energy-coupling factor transport system permease protein